MRGEEYVREGGAIYKYGERGERSVRVQESGESEANHLLVLTRRLEATATCVCIVYIVSLSEP